MAGVALTALAQNPVISGQFTADPTARVFNGKMYLYPSHDIPSPVERLKDWFCMADYHVFSSENLVDWKDHGIILEQNRIPWVEPDSYAMWAPDCVEKDGRYYFYFPASPKGEKRGFGIGVAVASSPEGPFHPMPNPIAGVAGIDPCVLVDDDGSSYIYWAGGPMRGARLNDNMMSLDGEPVDIVGLPEGFKEGPFVFKRGDMYYFTFPWVRNSTETLAYATGTSPLGPFEFRGVIMDESPVGCWTNHHSIVEYNGEWYLFYHHNDYSPDFDKNRSVRIDRLTFTPDGMIDKVIPTLRGVGVCDARRKIEIDRYSAVSSADDVSVDYIDRSNPFEGWKVILKRKGAWVDYNDVDFGSTPVTSFSAMVKAPRGGMLEVSDGVNVIAKIKLQPSGEWKKVSASTVADAPNGIKNLRLSLLKGRNVEVDWVGFDALPWTSGGFSTGNYRNFFAEMSYSNAEISAKLDSAYNALFHGPDKVYFEVGDSMAYISDIKNHDVRTEGMSYGMMIAVQLDKKDVFDRLWRWSKRFMQHSSGPREGYFAWSCAPDGTRLANGSASDGELYYVTSLIFAANRWGDDGEIRYRDEARNIVDCAMKKAGLDTASPFINISHKLITFTPDPWGGSFTDPSYHVPAFFEVWARWLGDGRTKFWNECAEESRNYLHRCINPATGLCHDYTGYDGESLGHRWVLGHAFRFDSWRVPMNIALDYSWSCSDPDWQRHYANLIQGFLYSKGIDDFVDQYNPDGTDVDEILDAGGYKALRHSVGLVATSAAVSLAATDMKSHEFVQRLWDSRHEPYDDGYFDAYYDGILRLFAFMHLSGNYRVITPES